MDKIKVVNITDEMKTSYINYAMSVIVERALPDARDGLKPVQRRIIYSMDQLLHIRHNTKYRKSVQTVGEVLQKFHPHGDVSVYDALVRMAQDFSMRNPLIDGQGNFGSVDGDSAAAMRYTEARLAKISEELVADIEKDTVPFRDNYDGTNQEPTILPSVIPNLLLNGSEGIAVGMATKIPPHNLNELMNALIFISDIAKKMYLNDTVVKGEFVTIDKFDGEYDMDSLLEIVKGPDFPTKAEIYNTKAIKEFYRTGKGVILMRAVAQIVEDKKKTHIVITELPFQVNKARLIEKIADITKSGRIEGISDIRDESARGEIRVVIDLKKDVSPNYILNSLYKFTEMQLNFNANMLALVDNEPKVLNLKNVLDLFIEHRQKIIVNRSKFDLKIYQARAHILEGLLKALDILDEVINTIRSSKTQEDAKNNLMTLYGFTDIQATAILDMQLRKLAALEREKLQNEYDDLEKRIDELITLLSSRLLIMDTIKEEFEKVNERYSTPRLTKIITSAPGEITIEDTISEEQVVITISNKGYIKRMQKDSFKLQNRGGRGVLSGNSNNEKNGEEEYIRHIINCSTLDYILLFTNKAKVFQIRAFDVKEYQRTAKGQSIVNLIDIQSDEYITEVITKSKNGFIDKQTGNSVKYIAMITMKGTVKKISSDEFNSIRKSGLNATKLENGDELVSVRALPEESTIIIGTKLGKAIHIEEKKLRVLGRISYGVRGIKLKGEDKVIGMDIVHDENSFVFTVSKKGYGKLTKITEFQIQNRGGSGVRLAKVSSKAGEIHFMSIIQDKTNLNIMLASTEGNTILVSIDTIPTLGRNTSGVKLIKLTDGAYISQVEIS